MAQRKKWSPKAKFEIALLALRGEMTLNEICTRYEVAASQVHAWKKKLLECGDELFQKADKGKGLADKYKNKEQQLFAKIGQLTVERDFLKKAWGKLHEDND